MAGLTDEQMAQFSQPAAPAKGLTDEEMAAHADAAAQPVRAGLEAAARTATFGVSDAFMKGYEGGTKGLKARKEANPVASGIGDVAGLFTPGPGAAVRAGESVGSRFAGKTAQRLVGGATEGALFGLGSAISEEHLTDPELTSEHLAAGTLGAALAGAGAHTVFGKFGDLGKSALVKAFGGKAVSDVLDSLAEKAVMRSITTPSDLGKKSLRGRVDEVGRFAIDEGFTKGAPSMKTASERAAARANDEWAAIEDGLAVADTVKPFEPAAAALRMSRHLDTLRENPSMAKIRETLQEYVDKFNPANADAPKTFSKAWETASKMWDQIGSTEAKGLKKELKFLRAELQDEIFGQLGTVDPKIESVVRDANRAYANSASFRDLTLKRADQIASGGFNLMDLAAGGGALAGLGVPGVVAPFASRAVRERGGFVAASALEALNESGALPKIANAFQLLIKSRLGAIPGFGGAFRATLETAAAKGAMDLLQTHLSLASDPDYMASVGLEHEDPGAVSGYVDKAHRLGQVSNAVDAAQLAVDQSVARVLGEQPGRAPSRTLRQPTREEYESLKAKLMSLVKDDGASRARITDLAPTTAGLAQMAIMNGAQHLLDTAPRDPTGDMPPALKKPWNPSKAELRSWFRRVEVVADPRVVLDAMRSGSVHEDQLETLKAVYPRLMREFQEKLTNRLADWTEPLDRRRKAQLGRLVGGFDDAQTTQLIQAVHARSIPPKPVSSDGRQVVDVEKNQQTQAQRLEEK